MPLASIIIPSHNEATVIGRLLTALAKMTSDGELDVHVVCNGCSDNTYTVASSYTGVKVHDLTLASKSAALNFGDQAAGEVFPRLYLDADIAVDEDSIRKVVEVLDTGDVLAAAPALRVVLEGRPLMVRDFYDIFLRLPWVTDQLVGSGFYGLSRQGHSRFTEFPDIINDDLFFRSLFSSDERQSVAGAEFFIEAPRTVSSLIRAKARVHVGSLEFIEFERGQSAPVREGGVDKQGGVNRSVFNKLGQRVEVRLTQIVTSQFWSLARRPSLWRPLFNYAGVRFAAKVVAYRSRMGKRDLGWAQDLTTREGALTTTDTQRK